MSPAKASSMSARELACIWNMRPTRSRFSLTVFSSDVPLVELARIDAAKVSEPMNGSFMILNASIDSGSSSSA